MPEENQIKIGDRLIVRTSTPHDSEAKSYVGIVEHITDSAIKVSFPVVPSNSHKTNGLTSGTKVDVFFWKKYGEHYFSSRIIKCITEGYLSVVLSKPASDIIIRTPRRKYFRVHTRIPALIYTTNTVQAESLQGSIIDLSAGGCRLILSKRIGAGNIIHLDFTLIFSTEREIPDQTVIFQHIPGEVKTTLLPAKNHERANPNIYVLGVQFSTLNKIQENALLHYIAFRERELIRKGVLETT